jgi:hypothetical protein
MGFGLPAIKKIKMRAYGPVRMLKGQFRQLQLRDLGVDIEPIFERGKKIVALYLPPFLR